MLELKFKPKVNGTEACPLCGEIGHKVTKTTVEHQLKDNIALLGEQFFLCRTSECIGRLFYRGQTDIDWEHLKSKIWFKKNIVPPIPICYCASVTEEEILYHIAESQCCSTLEDIKRHTGASVGRECLTKNPAGG
ncbi:(2Fe-2S)-binding protein [Desulfosporosinus burensis]